MHFIRASFISVLFSSKLFLLTFLTCHLGSICTVFKIVSSIFNFHYIYSIIFPDYLYHLFFLLTTSTSIFLLIFSEYTIICISQISFIFSFLLWFSHRVFTSLLLNTFTDTLLLPVSVPKFHAPILTLYLIFVLKR